MIDEKRVENILRYGVHHNTGTQRSKALFEDLGLAKDRKAEYVILSGCHPPETLPQTFRALKGLLDHLRISYTFLSKEYCCGWMPLGQPAVMAKDEAAIARAKELAQGFIRENFKQAEALGARSIVLFCAACEPTYTNFKEAVSLEVISYNELLERFFTGGKREGEIDYYAGCYRFRRRITQEPIDVGAARRILGKIGGLKVHEADNSLCCFVRPHLDRLVGSFQTKEIVAICTGCYNLLQNALKDREGYKLKMIPELLWEAVQGMDKP
jgi:Fe-S oxidoreductase